MLLLSWIRRGHALANPPLSDSLLHKTITTEPMRMLTVLDRSSKTTWLVHDYGRNFLSYSVAQLVGTRRVVKSFKNKSCGVYLLPLQAAMQHVFLHFGYLVLEMWFSDCVFTTSAVKYETHSIHAKRQEQTTRQPCTRLVSEDKRGSPRDWSLWWPFPWIFR